MDRCEFLKEYIKNGELHIQLTNVFIDAYKDMSLENKIAQYPELKKRLDTDYEIMKDILKYKAELATKYHIYDI